MYSRGIRKEGMIGIKLGSLKYLNSASPGFEESRNQQEFLYLHNNIRRIHEPIMQTTNLSIYEMNAITSILSLRFSCATAGSDTT